MRGHHIPHTKEAKKKMSKKASLRTGNKNNFFGRKHSKKTKEKMRQIKLKNPTRYWLGKNREMPKGENSNNWRGGFTPIQTIIRNSFKYRQWRSDVFTRDNYQCIVGGKEHGNKLNVDHIKSFVSILKEYNIKSLEQAQDCEELWNINNGRTLCKKCHEKTDNYGSKSIKRLTK